MTEPHSLPDCKEKKLEEILNLACELIEIPSVTACRNERLDQVYEAYHFIKDYLEKQSLVVQKFEKGKYPALLVGFPGAARQRVMLSGHFDVVSPEPDDRQFKPKIAGDYLWGRGAEDMKTTVATYMVWMKDALENGSPFPPISLLLVGNEETGEIEPMGTGHILHFLKTKQKYQPDIVIAGEQTGDRDDVWGEVRVQNRGVLRCEIIERGRRQHSAIHSNSPEMTDRLFKAKNDLSKIFAVHLTLNNNNHWKSQVKFPFIKIGTPGIYNITAAYGALGVEIRALPEDNLINLYYVIRSYCETNRLELKVDTLKPGIACDLENPILQTLLGTIRDSTGQNPRFGKELRGTSACFAPRGQGIVWGQSGLGHHQADERLYIPSIMPYYETLTEFGTRLLDIRGTSDPTAP